MDALALMVVSTCALAGGAGAWLFWRWATRIRARLGLRRRPRAGRRRGAPGAEPAAEKPRHAVPPVSPEPEVAARLASIEGCLADIARAQIRLIDGRDERDTLLLSELRAVIAQPTEEIQTALAGLDARTVELAGALGGGAEETDLAEAVAARLAQAASPASETRLGEVLSRLSAIESQIARLAGDPGDATTGAVARGGGSPGDATTGSVVRGGRNPGDEAAPPTIGADTAALEGAGGPDSLVTLLSRARGASARQAE